MCGAPPNSIFYVMRQIEPEYLKNTGIIMFGTGVMARAVWDHLVSLGVEGSVFACLDNDPGKQGSTFQGVPVHAPDDLDQLYVPGQTVILVTTVYYMDVIDRLLCEKPYIREEDLAAGISIRIPYDDDEEETEWRDVQYTDIREMLADELSRDMLDFVLETRSRGISLFHYPDIKRFSRDMWYWQAVETRHTGLSAVVDCGAYTGDSINQIYDALDGRVDKYFALEPDKASFDGLIETEKQFLEMNRFHGSAERRVPQGAFFENIPCGAWKETCSVSFNHYEKADASSVMRNRNLRDDTARTITVDMIRLDDLELGPYSDIWIKMDIEGSEMNALRGGAELIRAKAPRLAICAYHRKRDVVNIPLLIKRLNPDYKIYLRGGIHYVYYAQTY